MAYYALVKNNIVETVIVAEESFLKHLSDYHHVVELPADRPSVGDSYYPDTKAFVSNAATFNSIPVNIAEPHLSIGTDAGFEPFSISKYLVTYDGNGIVTIGCKQYPIAGLVDTLHKFLINKQKTTTLFTSTKDGPTHGKFGITWNDAQKLYETLIKVKIT